VNLPAPCGSRTPASAAAGRRVAAPGGVRDLVAVFRRSCVPGGRKAAVRHLV